MAVETGAGAEQEKYVAQLEEMVQRIQKLEEQNRNLQAKLDTAMNRIDGAHGKAFGETQKTITVE